MKLVFVALMILVMIKPLLGMESEDSKNIKWQGLLISLCENYQRYLPNQYACVCTKTFHYLVNSQTAKDEERKMAALTKLISKLSAQEWTAEQVEDFLEEMAPYIDDFGKSFFRCAIKMLPSTEKKGPSCSICMEATVDTVFFPCRHLATCEECAGKIRAKGPASECPICKRAIKSATKIRGRDFDVCCACKEEPPNQLHVPCMHLAECESCISETCGICQVKSTECVKVFTI